MDYVYDKINGFLEHHGIKGQEWGVRKYQNEDGSLTPAGRERYGDPNGKTRKEIRKERRYERFRKAQRNYGAGHGVGGTIAKTVASQVGIGVAAGIGMSVAVDHGHESLAKVIQYAGTGALVCNAILGISTAVNKSKENKRIAASKAANNGDFHA